MYPDECRKPFLGHLEDLRRCVLRSLAALVVTIPVGYYFSDQILFWMSSPVRDRVERLYYFAPQEAFLVKLKVAIFAGLILASPFVIAQI
ncbi:MAG: twin-arginine translocase subunit TatC, partial [Candidatus Omnitrophica bacterium]|nr:twin-arginine translocase subunit TatC [Candidatus Omnitrophota bacterium]